MKIRISDLNDTLLEEELRDLASAEALPPVFDADCPEMTAEKLLQFKRNPNICRTEQSVSLRLSPKTLKIARSYGKGHTSFLSRLLDAAINDEDLVRKCM